MRDRVRELLPVIVIAAVMAGAVEWGYSVWRSPHRNDLAAYGQYAIALAVLAGSVIAWARRWRTNIRRASGPPTTAELDELADQLAMVVKDEWTRAANDRGLLVPEPIPVQWRRPSVAIAGPVSASAGMQWFQPLPGMNAVTTERLKKGEIRDLHELYGGLGSGRLVIAGGPGAGKSGAAVLLILGALRHREHVDEADRPKVPVPVMFTLHGWNPDTQPVQDWLVVRLGQTEQLSRPVDRTFHAAARRTGVGCSAITLVRHGGLGLAVLVSGGPVGLVPLDGLRRDLSHGSTS